MGWHGLTPAFFLWPHCQSSQTGVCTQEYRHTRKTTHIFGLSRAGVRLSPNYSNYLSSKHSLPRMPPGIQREAGCVELRTSVGVGLVGVGLVGVGVGWYWVAGWREEQLISRRGGGNGGGGSWFFSCSPPFLTSLSLPPKTPTSGGKWLLESSCQDDLSTIPHSQGKRTVRKGKGISICNQLQDISTLNK